MRKLHLGAGPWKLEGWENHDLDVDITKTLPFPGDSIDRIFSEHCVEHIKPTEAWSYFEECFRVLKKGGIVRTTAPDISRVFDRITPAYCQFVKERGWGDGTIKGGLRHLVFNHSHQSLWTPKLLISILSVIGFNAYEVPVSKSPHTELNDIEQHWRSLGVEFNVIESVSVEAIK